MVIDFIFGMLEEERFVRPPNSQQFFENNGTDGVFTKFSLIRKKYKSISRGF